MKIFHQNSSHDGYTLFELLIVISIIGLITTAAITNWKAQIDKGNDAKRKADLKLLSQMFENYYSDHECYPTKESWDSASCDQVPDFLSSYIKKFPCDPTNQVKYTYQTTDIQGNECLGGCGECMGYRLLTQLQNITDLDIVRVGCDPNQGCGIVDQSGLVPNYGITVNQKLTPPGFVIE